MRRLEIWGFKIVSFFHFYSSSSIHRPPERLALKWVQTYIKEFGGDPKKVTMYGTMSFDSFPVLSTYLWRSWGESAGAISVSLHMLTNNGNQEGLFRGAVMQSGGPIPVGDIEHGQQYYDFMIKETGCKAQTDTLDCLRKVPYDTFKRAMDKTPNFFAYQVRVYLAQSPSEVVHDCRIGTCAGLVAPS